MLKQHASVRMFEQYLDQQAPFDLGGQQALLARIQQGDESAVPLVAEQGMRLVAREARRWARQDSTLLADLIQEGAIAMMAAARGWRPDGMTFASYSMLKIQSAFRDFVGQQHWYCMSVPDAFIRHAQKARALLDQRHLEGRDVAVEELAQALGVSCGFAASVRAHQDSRRGLEGARTIERSIGSGAGYPDPAHDPRIRAKVKRLVLQQAIQRLQPRERQIVELRFFRSPALGFDEVGSHLVPRVRATRAFQLWRSAREQLRHDPDVRALWGA